jgi:hypothetical protein
MAVEAAQNAGIMAARHIGRMDAWKKVQGPVAT